MHFSTLFTCASLVHLGIAGYTLEDDYMQKGFFSMFSFFTDADPTNGYVNYVNQGTAQAVGLINTNNNVAYMGVDSTNKASGRGRTSVRLTSNKAYNQGLVVLDLAHMPGGICGTWPAFWMVGPNWPKSGEIDIIEGVNSQSTNSMTLHTGPGCSIANNGGFSGSSLVTQNCDINAPGQGQNVGCSFAGHDTRSFGAGFNSNNGGVFATEWTDSAIRIWFFPRGSVPSDATGNSPNPSGWGTPTATFQGGCDFGQSFKNQNIVFDTTFCGDWAGQIWGSDPICSSKANTCNDFVQNNPSAFKDAYWSINSLKVYQNNGQSGPAAAPSPAPSPSAIPVAPPVAPPGPTSVAPPPPPPPVTTTFVPQPSVTKPATPLVVTVTNALNWNMF
ncbi:hypothetical protein MMC24_003190, partial [Lignoscripta atroalba]|nr:hypothetical protein [Lignoscripta atroalba]